jgi:2-phosphosulfolactate phosphatase
MLTGMERAGGTAARPTVNVALTPAHAKPAEATVVIDVIRASSTIVQALGSGYRRVLCADSLDRARALGGPGRVLAGERRCIRPADFDLGNSPGDTLVAKGEELVLATTNGAPAVVLAGALSPVVLVGALLNLDALVAMIEPFEQIQLLCSGTDGGVSIEDTYLAGRIVACLQRACSDSALVACAVAEAHPNARAALGAGQARRLLDAGGLSPDLDWCARESTVKAVPRLTALADGVATLEINRDNSMHQAIHIAGRLSLESVASRSQGSPALQSTPF